MGTCKNCIYFRSVKPRSQLIAQAIGTADASISNALNEISKDELYQQGVESEKLEQLERKDDIVWDFPPVMIPYCGLREDQGIYLVAQLKNLPGRPCEDFQAGQYLQNSCLTCAHRVAPKGVIKDMAIEKELSNVAGCNALTGMSTSIPDNLLTKHREAANTRKAFEITGAYSTKGHLMNPPEYLDYCGVFSEEGNYVICIFQNPHDVCPSWHAKTITSPITSESIPVSNPQTGKRDLRERAVNVATLGSTALAVGGAILSQMLQKKEPVISIEENRAANSSQDVPRVANEDSDPTQENSDLPQVVPEEELESENTARKVVNAIAVGSAALAIGGAILSQVLQKKRDKESSELAEGNPQALPNEDELTEGELEDLLNSHPELASVIKQQREQQNLMLQKQMMDMQHDTNMRIIDSMKQI